MCSPTSVGCRSPLPVDQLDCMSWSPKHPPSLAPTMPLGSEPEECGSLPPPPHLAPCCSSCLTLQARATLRSSPVRPYPSFGTPKFHLKWNTGWSPSPTQLATSTILPLRFLKKAQKPPPQPSPLHPVYSPPKPRSTRLPRPLLPMRLPGTSQPPNEPTGASPVGRCLRSTLPSPDGVTTIGVNVTIPPWQATSQDGPIRASQIYYGHILRAFA
jgi:hypothetical protein